MKKVTVLKIFIFTFFVLVGYGLIEYNKYILLLNGIKYAIGLVLCFLGGTLIPYALGSQKCSKRTALISVAIVTVSIFISKRNIDNGKILLWLYDKDILKTAIISLHIVIPLVAFICGVLEERENKI